MQQNNRQLTHDEKKAAEAAFQGLPFDPMWSEAARKVYLGLSVAISNKRNETFQEMSPSQPTTLANPAVETKARVVYPGVVGQSGIR